MDERTPRTAGAEPSEVRAGFERERKGATRVSGIAGGLVALVGMPVWSLFDYLLAPEQAWQFTIIRIVATAVIAVSLALLFTQLGRRRPEWLGVVMIGSVEIAVALMIVQLDDRLAAYALGMSLPLYASGLLVVWRLRYTVVLLAISFVSLGLGWLLAPGPTDAAEVATVVFYLLTAAMIAIVGQVVRDRAAWREYQTKAELEAEQIRTRELVTRLDRLSHEDSLTGLANRRAWDETIARECAQLRRADGSGAIAVLICDVDRLKEINDSFGHAMGDMVLRTVADLLRERIRASDLVARIGGDEFAVLASGTDEGEAAMLAEDLRVLVERRQPGGPGLGSVTLSVGVAGWEGSDDSSEALMLRADRRLYAAKSRRNVVCAGDPVEPSAG